MTGKLTLTFEYDNNDLEPMKIRRTGSHTIESAEDEGITYSDMAWGLRELAVALASGTSSAASLLAMALVNLSDDIDEGSNVRPVVEAALKYEEALRPKA